MDTLRIFLAGATGALGRRLVPQLIERGHHVTGTTRSDPDRVRALGAEPAVVDPLDAAAVRAAVVAAEPDVVVHQLTALSGIGLTRNFDKTFAMTNRLRTEGTDHLIAAARAAGARRLVWQSYAGWTYAPCGGRLKTEDDALDPEPPADARESLAAIRHLEAAVTGAEGMEGIVLRYGGFYGPGTSLDTCGEHLELIRKRRFQSAATGPGCGRWCTSTTRRRRPSPPSRAAPPASTTSSTTPRRRFASSSPRWRHRSARPRPGGSPAGSCAWPPARRRTR